MTLDGVYRATVDRVVEGRAVVLVEDDGRVVEEFTVPTEELPAEGRTERSVLEVVFDDGELDHVRADPEETDRRLAEAKRRFDRLARRPPTDEEGGSGGSGEEDDPEDGDETDGSGEGGCAND